MSLKLLSPKHGFGNSPRQGRDPDAHEVEAVVERRPLPGLAATRDDGVTPSPASDFEYLTAWAPSTFNETICIAADAFDALLDELDEDAADPAVPGRAGPRLKKRVSRSAEDMGTREKGEKGENTSKNRPGGV